MFVLPAQKDFKEHIIRSCYASDHHECTNYVTSATSAENQQNIPWNFQDNRSLTKTQNNKWTAIKTAASSGTHAWHLLPAIVLIVPVAGYAFDRVLTLLQHQFQLLHLPLAVDGVRQRRQHWTTSFNHRCTLHAINSCQTAARWNCGNNSAFATQHWKVDNTHDIEMSGILINGFIFLLQIHQFYKGYVCPSQILNMPLYTEHLSITFMQDFVEFIFNCL